jgi:type II secretory pathway pseudopilin PulG
MRHRVVAVSFVELLIVIAILAILLALLLPALNHARVQALESQETAQLHQLAVAHALYIAVCNDAEPGSTIPIIAQGYAPKTLVRTAFDPYPLGWANEGRMG